MDRWTRLGIEAYRTGNRELAQRFFNFALMEKPNDIRTWLWMVEVADTDAEKQRCLTRVLLLDPNHVLARRALEDVEARFADKNAPHISPFEQAAGQGGEPAQHKSAVEIRSTPPFIEELAQQNVKSTAGLSRPYEAQTPAGRKLTWTVIGFFLVGFVVLLLLLGWSLHLFGG